MRTRKVDILFERDVMTIIPKTVFAHEIPVLKAANPNAMIRLDPASQQGYQDEEKDMSAEYDQLSVKYGVNKDTSALNVVIAYGEKAQKRMLNESMNALGELIAEADVAPKPMPNIDPAHLTKEGLMAQLSGMGIEFDPKDTREALAGQLAEAWGLTNDAQPS